MENIKQSKGSILLMCAHSDDQILGAGGSMAKYAREGYDIFTIIFSYGESSHPHVQLKHIATTRVEESKEANNIVGGKNVFFLGLKDTKIGRDFDEKRMMPKLQNLMLKYEPVKIFTHSIDDFLPDHRAVYRQVIKAYDALAAKKKMDCDVYSFDIWNFWNLKKRTAPYMLVDISDHFKYKIRALHTFRSQINIFSHTILVNFLYIAVYFRAIINGFKAGCRFAEIFYKVR